MRFMKGVFRGHDGHVRDASFGFVWIDVYDPSSGGAQITDFNPGVRKNGLFWTTVIDDRDVEVDLAAGTGTFSGTNLHMPDFHDFENAILGNGETPTPAIVSFTVEWTATGDVMNFENMDQQYRGDMRNATAQMEWTASSGIYEYTSAPLDTSTTDVAQIGEESNGSFFWREVSPLTDQVPTPTGTIESVSVLIDVQGTADLASITFNGQLQKL